MTSVALSEPTAVNEQVVFLHGEEDSSLCGIVTVPATPLGVGVIVLSGGVLAGSTHRNDMTVHLSRALATAGFHGLRFDWHGLGDSTGWVERVNLDLPFVGDFLAAAGHLRERGLDRLLVVGACFGARTALAGASQVEGIEGLLLIAPPVARRRTRDAGARMAGEWSVGHALRQGFRPDVLRAMTDKQRRHNAIGFVRAKARAAVARNGEDQIQVRPVASLSPRFVSDLRHVEAKGIHVLFAYGERDPYYADFLAAPPESRAEIAESPHVDIRILPGEVHGFQRVAAQAAVLDLAQRWALESARADPPVRPEAGATTEPGRRGSE